MRSAAGRAPAEHRLCRPPDPPTGKPKDSRLGDQLGLPFGWLQKTRSPIFPSACGRGRLPVMPREQLPLLDVTLDQPGRADGLARTASLVARARRYVNRKPLQFCMFRLPPSLVLRLAERRPVLLLRGRRKSVVVLASRHLHALEQTPKRARRALLRASRRLRPWRIHKPFSRVQPRKSRLGPTFR